MTTKTSFFLLMCLWMLSSTATAESESVFSVVRRNIAGANRGLQPLLSLLGLQNTPEETTTASTTTSTATKDEKPTRIKLVVAGFGRMGTTSLQMALTILGYSVIHDDNRRLVFDLYAEYYNKTITAEELHYGMGHRGFDCVVSHAPHSYEWAATQQNKNDPVRVILNDRDPQAWVDSWIAVAAPTYDLMAGRPLAWIPAIQDFLPLLYEMVKVVPTNGQPEKFLDRDVLLQGYHEHYKRVRRTVPAEYLLDYKMQQGWEPLCSFLGVPVPDVPFPHANDRAKMMGTICFLRFLAWGWPVLFMVPLLGLVHLVPNRCNYSKTTIGFLAAAKPKNE